MQGVIEAVIKHPRTTISVLVMLVFAGIFARSSITVEADPDITIPLVMVTIPHIGISPEDADRLIVRPVESEVRSLEGIEEVNALPQLPYSSMLILIRTSQSLRSERR